MSHNVHSLLRRADRLSSDMAAMSDQGLEQKMLAWASESLQRKLALLADGLSVEACSEHFRLIDADIESRKSPAEKAAIARASSSVAAGARDQLLARLSR